VPQTKPRIRRPKHPRKEEPLASAPLDARVLTLSEAATYLRVSELSVEALASQDDLPGRKIEGQWRFLKAALDDWLRSPSPKQRLMKQAGALRDDPYLDEMLEKIYRERGRPMVEDE
jgi:excisionase family DNA binding protein